MARNSVVIDAPPDIVYDVLTDAEAYSQWVVGAKRVRATDRQWPRRGGRFHHTVGVGPAKIRDSSRIVAKRGRRHLELDVRFRPIGTAHVELDLQPLSRGRRTRVVMRERPTSGPVRWFFGRPLDLAFWGRNAWSLRRLRRVAEDRAEDGHEVHATR
jgi:uncharacterized protein YndB with AHSA1/START domain